MAQSDTTLPLDFKDDADTEEFDKKGLEKLVISESELTDIPIPNDESQYVETDNVPLEFQCEEFKDDDPNMDPLEWTVRKGVSIPKAYYWDTGNYDVPLRI